MNKLILCILIIQLSYCKAFTDRANNKFGDQHFKTAIALIELHKTRFNQYPESLEDLKYIGEWDKIAFSRVKYQKLLNGYKLDLTGGWIDKPNNLNYPKEFWNNLGLKESNMKN